MDHDVTGIVTDSWVTGSNVALSLSMSLELLKYTENVSLLLKTLIKEQVE